MKDKLASAISAFGKSAKTKLSNPSATGEPGEAFLVGVALLHAATDPGAWPDDVQARIFLLERTFDGPGKGILCERTGDSHVNHGHLLPVEAPAFLAAIGRVLQNSKKP